MYARSDLARTGLFAHCPEDFIISAYRLPLILRELFSYQSDIICLQEVDRWVYDKHLLHAFKYHQNMDGLFLAKRAVQPDTNDPHKVRTDIKKEKDEGCAIFYSSSRFELVSQYDLPSILHYASTVPFLSIMLDNLNSEKLNSAGSDHSFGEEDIGTHIQKSLSQCLLAGVFRVKSTDSQPTFFIVSNTHFYFHPSASAIRVIQAHTVRHHLLKIAMQYNQPDSNPIPIIFCGDINQSPGSGPYTALTQGDNCLSQEKTTYQPTFESVYANNPPEFTNWVPGFYSVLDVILYNTDSNLRCIRFLPIDSLHQMKQRLIEQVSADGHHIPDDSKLGLPNAYFPSDHVALVADFSWDSLK
ncbi:unnamed protein product [Heterobilharzia americana]|nr:unnamed protein product [Heterobilharzia americana]